MRSYSRFLSFFLLFVAIIVSSFSQSSLLFSPNSCNQLADDSSNIIDSLVNSAIRSHIFPGCQIIAIHSDTIIFYKNYGFLTYDSVSPVDANTSYDVASMTKSLATTLAVMKLYDDGKIRLTDTVGQFLDYSSGTPVASLTIAELLTHTSGLSPFIPFYREISNNGVWDSRYLRPTESDSFSIVLADSVFLRYDYPDIVRAKLVQYPLLRKQYRYSDLGFFLLCDIVETILDRPMDEFLYEYFYQPMGLTRTGFLPLYFIHDGNIAPTENDTYFRKRVIKGYVHDQTASVMGGVCGNAGLFSTAQEVGALLSMLMHGGVYKGRTYLSQKTVRQFVTTCPMHNCQRRALGFDTPSFPGPSEILPAAAGKRTFGHQGFTGTVFWCDPENDLIYVFLSNRVYPDAEPNKLSKSRLRLIVHELIYHSLGL